MNRFVRNFIVLPLIFFVFLFHVGLIVGCTCGTPRPGQQITTVIFSTSEGKQIRNDGYQKLFTQIIFEISNKTFWSPTSAEAPLLTELNKASSKDVKKLLPKFRKDYLSSQNNRFKYFVLNTRLPRHPTAFEEKPNDFKKFFGKLDVNAYFWVEATQKYWKLKLTISGVQGKITNNKITALDINNVNLIVEDLKETTLLDFNANDNEK